MTPLWQRLRVDPIQIGAIGLAIFGILGSLVGPDGLIVFTAIGLFGPLLLRESGAIPWRDEFQRETTLRACMHALIAVGILVVATMATQGYGGLHERMDSIGASTVLWVLGLTWGLSKLLQVWGAPDGAFRLLFGYTAVLLTTATTRVVLFGTEAGVDVKDGPPSTLLWGAILAWLVGLTLLSRWRPRITGWLLLLTAAMAVPLLQDWIGYVGGSTRGWTKTIDVLPVAALPLLAAGLSLISMRSGDDEDDEAGQPRAPQDRVDTIEKKGE